MGKCKYLIVDIEERVRDLEIQISNVGDEIKKYDINETDKDYFRDWISEIYETIDEMTDLLFEYEKGER